MRRREVIALLGALGSPWSRAAPIPPARVKAVIGGEALQRPLLGRAEGEVGGVLHWGGVSGLARDREGAERVPITSLTAVSGPGQPFPMFGNPLTSKARAKTRRRLAVVGEGPACI
jgi:hypothetical protein